MKAVVGCCASTETLIEASLIPSQNLLFQHTISAEPVESPVNADVGADLTPFCCTGIS